MASSSSSSSNCRRRSTTKDGDEVGDATDFSNLVVQEIGFVRESFEVVKMKASQKIDEANLVQNQFEELMVMPKGRAEERDYKLRQLKMKVSKLRMQIPFKLIAPEEQTNPNIIRWRRLDSDLYRDKEISHSIPDIDDNSVPPVPYHKIQSILGEMEFWVREFVACFVFFPKNALIKRCVIFFLRAAFSVDTSQTGLGLLVEKGLVQTVYKKSNLTVDGYRMLPSVHDYLRSEESGFRGWTDMYVGSCHDVEERFIYHSAQDFEKFDDYTRRLKTALHLGKWNNSTEQHIEIINPESFFKHISKLTSLRYVSLRGISMIEELPKFITELKHLEYLDLRACHNLVVIPPSIANLRGSLAYLDISECYFLDHMPKALASLTKLRVLKGFVVGANKDGKSCSLEGLKSLHLLKKLNIYTSMNRFPTKSQFQTLKDFSRLVSLTISWGGCSAPNGLDKPSQENEYGMSKEPMTAVYGFNLEKLDLQCVPETVTRCWLTPTNFRNLNKFYIRGGNFSDLRQSLEGSQWSVETLRLQYLCKLKMGWGELQELFPSLMCLEKVDCPNLHGFPCNDNGIWIKNQQA